MRIARARIILVEALVDDQIQSLCDDPHGMEPFLRGVLSHGHVGYVTLSNEDLVRNVTDAGLQEEDDLVNEACETLERS